MLSQSTVTRAPQARQARANCENLNYMTLESQARLSGDILKNSLSHYSDILVRSLVYSGCSRPEDDGNVVIMDGV